MPHSPSTIAIVYTSRDLLPSIKATKDERLGQLRECGFNVEELAPHHDSDNGYTAGCAIERAAILSHALSNRKYAAIWVARGGYGASAMVPFLENMLPPVISSKILIGFSDVSYMGNYLSERYPNLTYVHGNHPFDKDLFSNSVLERDLLFALVKGDTPPSTRYPGRLCFNVTELTPRSISGLCVPLNLSLGESLAATRHIEFPPNTILFLEDLLEDTYKIQRKMDSLRNSGLLKNVLAVVVGNFTDCLNPQNETASEHEVARLISRSTRLPVFYLPIFGHDICRHPLVAHSKTTIERFSSTQFTIELSFQRQKQMRLATRFSAELERPPLEKGKTRTHFTGIGGTGMAAVAGLFVQDGFCVSGSDGPIYPPMSTVINDLGIHPAVGYTGDNIEKAQPDFVVLSNAISRRGPDLKPNLELEHLLTQNIPVLSFPSALRKYFLHKSANIVVSGTHGKTTTTALIAQTLSELKKQPSFLIGGAPKNFDSGFRLASDSLFILEGDEYDTAFFDKGPKFLHYEPSVALINNIEFDHADIYANVEAIEDEFERLACLTRDRHGVVVANFADARVKRVVKQSECPYVAFGDIRSEGANWVVESWKTLESGSDIRINTPAGDTVVVRTQMFGAHNALNTAACLAVLHALSAIENKTPIADYKIEKHDIQSWCQAIGTFQGVRRRFELVGLQNNIAVFDDFAHHPTAIDTTLRGFRDYMKASGRNGRLIACFDPRNATMRRRVLQEQLSKSFTAADIIYFGKVPVDQRIASEDVLDGLAVAKACGSNARYFADNQLLHDELVKVTVPGDTVVFMSSGSFDNLPRKFLGSLPENPR